MNEKLSPETVKVGMGVTEGVGSDRYASTVAEVSKTGKTIKFTHDVAQMKVGFSIFTKQEYVYASVEPYYREEFGFVSTNMRTARWSAKRNAFVITGSGGRCLTAGRNQHYDPSY